MLEDHIWVPESVFLGHGHSFNSRINDLFCSFEVRAVVFCFLHAQEEQRNDGGRRHTDGASPAQTARANVTLKT